MSMQYRLCLALSATAILCLGLILPRLYFAFLLVFSLCGWLLTNTFISHLQPYMLKNDIFGYDINKKGSEMGEKKIAECMGFASALAFVVISFFYWPEQYQRTHLAVSLTILSTILLGFADDMLDLKWRYKLIFPFFFMVPTLKVFTGSTSIPVPYPISLILSSDSLDLSYIYLFYLILLGIYFTNTINIYAGINGLEVGQSIVAACCMLILYAVRYLLSTSEPQIINIQEEIKMKLETSSQPNFSNCEYSSFLLLLFIGVSLALMKYNAYPSQMFVGDTYCYFSGIVLAMAAIFSQTSIICHFLMIPQLINFLYSVPQLFGFYECPRHRLTKYNRQTDKLQGIRTNMNLLNLSLRILGPTNEGVLCTKLLVFQIGCSLFAIFITVVVLGF